MTTPAILSGAFLRVTLANFFFFLNFASFFLLPLHVKALGGNEAMVGVVMGTAGLAGLVVLPAIAVAIDRLGRRRFLVLGSAGMALVSAGFLLVDEIGPMLFVLRVCQGVCFSVAFTEEFRQGVTAFLADDVSRVEAGNAALKVIEDNLGATARILQAILGD